MKPRMMKQSDAISAALAGLMGAGLGAGTLGYTTNSMQKREETEEEHKKRVRDSMIIGGLLGGGAGAGASSLIKIPEGPGWLGRRWRDTVGGLGGLTGTLTGSGLAMASKHIGGGYPTVGRLRELMAAQLGAADSANKLKRVLAATAPRRAEALLRAAGPGLGRTAVRATLKAGLKRWISPLALARTVTALVGGGYVGRKIGVPAAKMINDFIGD